MNAHPLGRAAAGLTTAVTLTLTCGVGAASAATGGLTTTQEDPTASTYLGGAPVGPNSLVGVGSDTTQDVEYGVAQVIGKASDGSVAIASWTATGTTPLTYRSGGVPTSHPNGSGAGFKALEESIGLIPSGSDAVGIGDVDFARAATFQGTQISGGVLTEIPFAFDSAAFVVPAGSPFLKTNGGAGLKISDLAAIYTGTDTYIDVTTGDLLPTSTPITSGDPTEPIQGFLPKPGSGVRQTFLKQLNAVNSAVPYGADKGDSAFTAPYPATAVSPYIGALTSAGKPVQQNDATVLETAPSGVAAFVPFSSARFISYHNGLVADPSSKVAGTDYVAVPFDSQVAISSTNASPKGEVLPYTVDGSGSYVPTADYNKYGAEGTARLAFEAFNIIPTAAVTNPNASTKYAALNAAFVGSGSQFCAATATIASYGFLQDAKCGDYSRTAGQASASTVTVTHTPAVAGRSSVFTVSVQSIGNGGGTVQLTVNGGVHSGTIPAGSTSVDITVPTPAAGTFSYGNGASDGFTPNLAGVASAPINADSSTQLTFTVTKAAAKVVAAAPKVSHLKKTGYVVVHVYATGITPTGSVKVVLKNAKNVTKYSFPAKALFHGGAKVSFNRTLPKGTYYVWVTYSGNGSVTGKPAAKLAKLVVV